MLKSISDSLHNIKNPLGRIKKRFTRYVVITSCMGCLSFLVALALLHAGFAPLLSLVISALSSGLLSYGAMELWAFPHREGKLSVRRLVETSVVGIGGFAARYVVLTLALKLAIPEPFHNAVPLALAYLASFLFGYILRSQVIFRK